MHHQVLAENLTHTRVSHDNSVLGNWEQEGALPIQAERHAQIQPMMNFIRLSLGLLMVYHSPLIRRTYS
jgi:hypothetical protein